MNQKTMTIILVVACAISGSNARPADPTARRYLDMFEIDRYSPHTDLNASLTTTRFRLLERPEVQKDLSLSQDQMLAVRTAYKTPWKEIPGLSDFIAKQKEKRQDLPEDELVAHNAETALGISRLAAVFYEHKLSELLTPQQHDRLDQLLIQTHGPVLIMVQTALASALAITPEQMVNLTAQVHKDDREIIPELQQFGRGLISGYGPGETEQTRERTMQDLINRLRRLIRQRDDNILATLSDDQQQTFSDLQGKPLQIEWSPWDLMKTPFEKEGP